MNQPLTIPAWPGGGNSRSPNPAGINATARPINAQIRAVPARNRYYGTAFGETWLACDPDIVEEKNGFYYLRGIACLGELDAILEVEVANATYATTNPEASGDYRGDWDVAGTWSPPNDLPYNASVGEIYRFGGLYYRVNQAFTVTDTVGNKTPTGNSYRGYFDRVYANTSVNGYTGSPGQGVDPLMVEYFGAGYTETLTGNWYGHDYALAYVTARIPVDEFSSGWPSMRVKVRGYRCYDPRTGNTAFTRNPVLELATMLVSPLFGSDKRVDWDSVKPAADRCDDVFPDGPRIECNIEIGGKPTDTQRWIEVLRGYAGVMLDYRDGVFFFVTDAPRESDWSIDFAGRGADMDMLALPEIDYISVRNRKNVVRVKYTDTTQSPWKEAPVEEPSDAVTNGDEVPRVQDYRMPGLTVEAQAIRFAKERLAELELERWIATVPVADLGGAIGIGNVVTLNSPNGFEGDRARVLDKVHPGVGLWLLRCREYNASGYQEP